MTARPSWSRWLVRLGCSVVLASIFWIAAVFALFAVPGLSHVDARETSPNGIWEARAERQGGSMEYPATDLFLRRHTGWLEAAAPECRALRWSDRDLGRNRGGARQVGLRWRDDGTLVVSLDRRLPPPAGRPCGITILMEGPVR